MLSSDAINKFERICLQVDSIHDTLRKADRIKKEVELDLARENETPLLFDEVLQIFGWKSHTLYRYVSSRKIPHYKVGNRLLFFRSELLDFIKQHRIRTKDEIKNQIT